VEKFGAASQATSNYIIWYMHFACWITKSRDMQSEYVTLIAVAWQPQLREHASMYVIHTLLVLLCSKNQLDDH